MIVRLLSLLLVLATAPSLVSPIPACCPSEWGCCAHEGAAELPAPADDCCSIASLNEYFAVSAPLVPQMAPASVPSLATVADVFPTGMSRAVAAIRTPVPIRFHRFEILRN